MRLSIAMGGCTKLSIFQQCSHRNSRREETILIRSDVNFSLVSQANCQGPWPQTQAWLVQTCPLTGGLKSFGSPDPWKKILSVCLGWPTRAFPQEIHGQGHHFLFQQEPEATNQPLISSTLQLSSIHARGTKAKIAAASCC